MKSGLLLLLAVIIILLLPASLTAINDFRMQDYTASYLITTTNVTTASATLTQFLYNDSVANVSFSSNNTADVPLALSYVPSSKVLSLDGLELAKTRALAITYKIDSLTDYTGASVAVRVWPIFLVLGVIGLIAGAVYNAMRGGD